MTLTFAPAYGWQLWLAVLVVAAAGASLVAAWWLLERRHLGTRRTTEIFVSSGTAIAAVFLAIALAAPTLERRGSRASFHVVVLVDVSDSMARAPGGLARARALASARLRIATASADANATAQVLTFRSEVAAFARPGPLRNVADRLDEIPESAFAVGPGTNIASGLVSAADAIERAGGRGAVVLVSDGNETDGDGLAAAAQLAARGIPIHVLPIAAGAPALGIVSANLPGYVDAGSETYVRGVLGNAAGGKQAATLALSAHAVATGRPNGDVFDTRRAIEVAGRQWAQFRTPVVFAQPGLQFVDVAVDGPGSVQRRRLFTHVERPPRVLAIGDVRWTGAFPPGAIQTVRKDASALGPSESVEDFDAIVIDGVPAGAFAPGALARIAAAVSSRKTGLFLANGPHTGSPLSATTVMSYDDTPLEPLLPLVSEARARQGGPPPRHLVMLMDTSGSMCGGPLTTAQQIAVSIVDRYLRPHDLLDLMAFTTAASAPLTDEPMTPQGKARAMDEIRRMTCNGGTDPQEALQQLAARRLKNCGLLFFSDGGFGQLRQLSQYRPDCRTTVFGIRAEPFSPNEPMSALADPIHIDAGFDPQRIKIPYFDQDAKNRFFEPGSYTALSMKHVLPSGFAMEVPEIPSRGIRNDLGERRRRAGGGAAEADRSRARVPRSRHGERRRADHGVSRGLDRARRRACRHPPVDRGRAAVGEQPPLYVPGDRAGSRRRDRHRARARRGSPAAGRSPGGVGRDARRAGARGLGSPGRGGARDVSGEAHPPARRERSRRAVRARDRRDARAEGVGSRCARPPAAHPDAPAAAAAALWTPCRRVVQLRTERGAAARHGDRREAAATMWSSA